MARERFSPRASPRRREPSRHTRKEYTAPKFPLRRYARRTRAASSGFSLSSSTNFLVFRIARVNSSTIGIVARWDVRESGFKSTLMTTFPMRTSASAVAVLQRDEDDIRPEDPVTVGKSSLRLDARDPRVGPQ